MYYLPLPTSSLPTVKTTVECLQSEINKHRADVDKLKEVPEASRERHEVAPRVPPRNYPRAVTQPNQAKRLKRKKPPSSASTPGSSPLPGSSSVPGPSSSHAGVGKPVPNECTSTRPRARTNVDGARKIWGTMNQTSVKTVQNAISHFCKMDGLSIKKKRLKLALVRAVGGLWFMWTRRFYVNLRANGMKFTCTHLGCCRPVPNQTITLPIALKMFM